MCIILKLKVPLGGLKLGTIYIVIKWIGHGLNHIIAMKASLASILFHNSRKLGRNLITSAKEVLNLPPFVHSVCSSFHPFVSRITLILLVPLFWKNSTVSWSKQLRSLLGFSFIHFIVWIQKIIKDPDCPIDFLLGGAKNFRIGRGMHSPSSCYT